MITIRKILLCVILLAGIMPAFAQDSVRYRIIFIGDAGEMDMQQSAVLKHAANNIIKNKTIVMYLGDNIYPHGMGLPGSPEEEQTKKILQSQYQPMRAKGAPVYFVPGNHDWDKMGPQGLAKIKRQWEYLQEQQDSLLKLVPPNGCPDPIEIKLTDSLTVIAFDSEWWLFPYNKTNPGAECDCKTRGDIIAKFRELLDRNRNKVILIASHHPFQSYGLHGGYFTWKDHLFPLTTVNENLWIPLPIVGSLYPFLRSTFPNPEDMEHPLYKEMIRRIDSVFVDFPNMIHVAGHEHGLQFIKSEQLQVVSGAGAKSTHAHKGKNSLFATSTQGYVTADLLSGNRMRFTYYVDGDSTVKQAFTYTQPYTNDIQHQILTFKPITADSVITKVHPSYNDVSGIHRSLFGEGYRKEWSADTKLPVIRISQFHGGLTPLKAGGGFQTKSLRLVDKSGREWVLRGVEKSPEKILPAEFQETFAKDWVNDAMSAQHPFSALIVPPLAEAAKVPHANPIIGVVSADANLGIYNKIFENKVCLLEEREPIGGSKNTIKTIDELNSDNDNSFDSREFLRARMLDLLIGDWDRHEDQWRWMKNKGGKEAIYTAIPRDRDQALYVSEGLFHEIASKPYVAPVLQGFDGKINSVKYSLFKTRFLNSHPASQFSYAEWMKMVNDFVAAETDAVFEAGLKRLPESSYRLRHDDLLRKLKERRANLPAAMAEYYRFINKIVDIHTSDKNEQINITDAPNNGLNVVINKINKNGNVKDTLMNANYAPDITKELRFYVAGGDDKVIVNTSSSPIKLKIIDSTGNKTVNVIRSNKKVQLYGRQEKLSLEGDSSRVNRHPSKEIESSFFVPVNLYNTIMPLASAGINADDGFLLGAGFKYIHQEGFRKFPYNSLQQLMVSHSFSTKAFNMHYDGEWIHAIDKADFIIQAQINAPGNTLNFFGRGNETEFDKTGDYTTYYRTRFNTYQFDPAFRWRTNSGSSLSIGPSVQYYQFDEDDNKGRFINNTSEIGSYDSLTIAKEKIHAGLVINFTNDKRDNKIFPGWGSFVNIKVIGYAGLNNYSKSFIQIIPEIALYKSLDTKSVIVLAERLGGGITIGNTAFYQSLFLGGQDNLFGYKQYRFAGQHSIYNNLEMRIKLGDFANYILPGQYGIMGFFDIGRVWENGEHSNKWHTGTGGGAYFAPARAMVLSIVAGHSQEGWYPYISTSFRF